MSEDLDDTLYHEEVKVKAPISSVTRDIGIDIDAVENLSSYASQINLLGLEERRIMMTITGPQQPLPFPTRTVHNIHGAPVEIYDIPEEKRQEVLNQLYFLTNTPAMDAEMLDIHEEKLFHVRDFMVTREGLGNFLVCPAYLRSGGTLLDWLDLSNPPHILTTVEQIKPGFMEAIEKSTAASEKPSATSKSKTTE